MSIAPRADRRDLLRLAAATALGACLPAARAGARRWRFDPFGLGVASGSPRHDSVVLWTRLLAPGWFDSIGEDPVPVRWEVAHDEHFTRIAQAGEALAMPALAHSVHVEPAGLEPDRWYFYRFRSGEVDSPVGRTRTLPNPGDSPALLRLAYASCQRWEHGYYGAYRHMLEEQLDFVMFLGDYIYEYPNATAAIRNFPTLGLVHTLDDYRRRHALHRSDAALQAMHAACPWLVTWDDHEVQNDYAGLVAGDSRPLGLNASASFLDRRNAAYQAWYEHMPVRASALARAASGALEVQVPQHLRFGRLADLLVLDTRQWRDRQACRPPSDPGGLVDPATCEALRDPARTLLGAAQERWLDARLSGSVGRWTVMGQQTLFGKRDNLPGPGERLWNDGWDGYPAARRRVIESLQRHQVGNPVVLGGDVHENWVGHIKADYERPESAAIGVEFCGTSITSRAGGAARVPQRLAENPHFVFADGLRRGYGVCEFTPAALSTTLRVVQDVGDPATGIETLARFEVAAGRPQIKAV
ncbi:alkaline phosphatase D family protein [Ramlibacter rhizophilus]|uniref:Alkaline phosphatase n=1 Tax=Ramlibacter rhizophilus TaxID=1781167 RepID=A0A4Z0BE35_9BURK|nr:alkaline phosphatase D family protein [Ramlibacter rhizophilus]TFY96733.1 alkaline phosphatase [Ramlibacter rhizophilus]